MPYPIIHIGYSKTATTWFQKFYFPNVKNAQFIDKKSTNKLIFCEYPNYVPFFNRGRILLSSEGISGPVGYTVLEEKQWKLNAQRLASIFPDAKIIIFIRNQIDMMTSIYSQYLRNGGTYSPNKYFFSANNYFKKSFLEYHYLIEYYKQIFSKTHIFAYEEFADEPVKFIRKFERELGINALLDYNLLNVIQNPSIIDNNFFLIRFINQFINTPTIPKLHIATIPKAVNIRNMLFRSRKEKGRFKRKNKKQLLSPRETLFLKEYYANSNTILLNDHGLTFVKEYNYPL